MLDNNVYFDSRRANATVTADKGDTSVNVGQDDDSLVDVNINPDINISIPESGIAAAGIGVGSAALPAVGAGAGAGAGAGVAAGAGAGTSGFAAAVPVVGQVVAAAAIIYSIVQMIDAADKQKQLRLAIQNLQVQKDLMESEVDIIQYGASLKIDAYNKEIQRQSEIEQKFQTYRIIAGGLIGVASLLLIYSIVKKK